MFTSPEPPTTIIHPNVYYAEPIVDRLRHRGDIALRVSDDAPTANGMNICTLISPSTLLEAGPFRLLPGMGIIARTTAGSERIVSPVALTALSRLAVAPNAWHLVPLVKVLLLERGLPAPAFCDEGTSACEGKLVSGNSGRETQNEAGFDLGELWHETTGLPLVLGVWACSAGTPYRKLRLVVGEASRDAAGSDSSLDEIYYSLLSLESDSLRMLQTLAIKHGLAESNEEAVVFC